MIRNLMAAVLVCVYVAGSIWIVQSAGRSYRAGLNKARPLAVEIDRASPSSTEATAKVVPPVAVLDNNTARVESAIPKPSTPAPVAEPSVRPVLGPRAPVPSPTERVKAEPATSRAEEKKAAHSATKSALANPLTKDAFWNQPQLTKVWDVAYLKLDDERRLRDDLHKVIVQFNPLVRDSSPWLIRAEEAADPVLKTLRRKDVKYKFFILDSDRVNAFSIPGGYVYISRGLFDLIGEDEDYALQFAIGHEIAHVDLEHAIKCLRDPGVMNMKEGTLQKLFMLILPYGYLRSDTVDQEFDADDWVANKMQRLGRTRREILVFLNKLDGYAKANGFASGEMKPERGRDLSPLENHYRAQTAPRKRLKHLKEFMDQVGNAPK